MTELNSDGWYIVKRASGHCDIVMPTCSLESENFSEQDSGSQHLPDLSNTDASSEEAEDLHRWGPFDSQSEAIARRVGLIRSGRCKPI